MSIVYMQAESVKISATLHNMFLGVRYARFLI